MLPTVNDREVATLVPSTIRNARFVDPTSAKRVAILLKNASRSGVMNRRLSTELLRCNSMKESMLAATSLASE